MVIKKGKTGRMRQGRYGIAYIFCSNDSVDSSNKTKLLTNNLNDCVNHLKHSPNSLNTVESIKLYSVATTNK